MQGGVEAWTRQQVLASGAQCPHRQTDRQTAPWTQVEPQTAAAAAETTEAGRTEKGERGLPGPRGLPAATPAQGLGDPGRNGGQWLQVLQNTGGTQSRGSARAPRGARGARLCESPLRDPSAGAGFAAAALGAAAGARDAGSAPPSLSCEDRCARHANVIPKTAARSQATPRAGLCSPWSGHAPPNPDHVSLRWHAERHRPPQQGGLNDPRVTCLAASFVPPHVGTRDMHGRAPCPMNEVLHNHDV